MIGEERSSMTHSIWKLIQMHPWPTLSRLSMTQFVPPLPNLILPLLVPTVMRPTLASYSPRPIMVPIFIRYQTFQASTEFTQQEHEV